MFLGSLKVLSLFSPAARTSTVNGSAVDLKGYDSSRRQMQAYLDNGTTSGTTPTLDVTIQDSDDGSTGWATVATFAQKTAAGTEQITVQTKKRYVRAVATIGGTTPSFTCAVTLAINKRYG